MKEFIPNKLPLKKDIETKEILRSTIKAHKTLAELKGIANSLPNQKIVINTLVLQEAKDSSEIENIITTHDEIYRSSISDNFLNSDIKEVQNYKDALYLGFEIIKTKKLLTVNHIKEIQSTLEENDAGFRKQSGTVLKNPKTGEIKLIPPQNPKDIEELMSNLVDYINDPSLEEFDSLVKMAIIHYQFESIHPFYDGNGRTGRIINILYLILKDLLDIPVLYLSRYIITHKADYYRLLQEVRTEDKWEEWILYMLDAVEQTSLETIELINNISDLMIKTQDKISQELPKIYSKDLVEILFMHPYTKIDFLVGKMGLHRHTASTYLNELENIGILKPIKIGRSKYFINLELFDMLKKGI